MHQLVPSVPFPHPPATGGHLPVLSFPWEELSLIQVQPEDWALASPRGTPEKFVDLFKDMFS